MAIIIVLSLYYHDFLTIQINNVDLSHAQLILIRERTSRKEVCGLDFFF
jgi:hypothetical protein